MEDQPLLPNNNRKSLYQKINEASVINKERNYTWFHALIFWISVIGFFFCAFAIAYYTHYILPEPLSEDVDETLFSEARSLKYLSYLVEKIGPRHASTDSYQNTTLLYLYEQLSQIQENSDPSILLEIELIRSAPYAFQYYQYPKAATVLGGTSLLIARISKIGVENSTANSLLLSCHPDSVPGGLAAFDASQGCSNHLEVIRALSKSPNLGWKNSIIVGFVAEEHGISAHLLITKHPWAAFIRGFVNMEGAGNGGQPILYRAGVSGVSWLVDIYEKSPHPVGTNLLHVIASVRPQTTDYDTYTQYGKSSEDGAPLAGIDLVYFDRRSWYHSTLDTLIDGKPVTPGSLQMNGENILFIAREFVDNFNVHDMQASNQSVIYFQFASFFLSFRGSTSQAIAIVVVISNFLMITLGIFFGAKQGLQVGKFICNLIVAFVVLLTSVIVALLTTFVISGDIEVMTLKYVAILNQINPLHFVSKPMLSVVTYGFWGLLGFSVIHFVYFHLITRRYNFMGEKGNIKNLMIEGKQLHVFLYIAIYVMWNILLIIFLIGVPSLIYLPLFYASFPGLVVCFTAAMNVFIKRVFRRILVSKYNRRLRNEIFITFCTFCGQFVPLIPWAIDGYWLFTVLSVELARVPNGIPFPEYIFGVCAALHVIMGSLGVLSQAHRYNHWPKVVTCLTVVSIGLFIASALVFPFDYSTRGMRTWNQHVVDLSTNQSSITCVPITYNHKTLNEFESAVFHSNETWTKSESYGFATQFSRPASDVTLQFPSHFFTANETKGQLHISIPPGAKVSQYVIVSEGNISDPFSDQDMQIVVEMGYRDLFPNRTLDIFVLFSIEKANEDPISLEISGQAMSALTTEELDNFNTRVTDSIPWAYIGCDLFRVIALVNLTLTS